MAAAVRGGRIMESPEIVTLAAAKAYTDSVALNGVAISYPTVNPATQTWRFFDPTIPCYVETPYMAVGQTPQPGANGNWWIEDVDTGFPSRG